MVPWHPSLTLPQCTICRRLLLFRLWELSETGPNNEKLMARLLPCTNATLDCEYNVSFRNRQDPSKCHSETGGMIFIAIYLTWVSLSVEWYITNAYATRLWAWSHTDLVDYQDIVEPGSGFLLEGTLVVSAEIRRIITRQDELENLFNTLTMETDLTLCNIEFIGLPTILDRMDHKKTYGIASTSRKRMRVVHAASTLNVLLNVR